MQWNDLLFAVIVAFLLATSVFTIYYLWVYRPTNSESTERDSEGEE